MGTGVFQHFVTTDSLMAFPGLKAPFKVPLLLLLEKNTKLVTVLFVFLSKNNKKKSFQERKYFSFLDTARVKW